MTSSTDAAAGQSAASAHSSTASPRSFRDAAAGAASTTNRVSTRSSPSGTTAATRHSGASVGARPDALPSRTAIRFSRTKGRLRRAAAQSLEAAHLRRGDDGDVEPPQLGEQRVDEPVHAAAEAPHSAAGPTLPDELGDAAREGTGAGHRLVEAGRHDVEVEVVRIGGVHARRDRRDEPVEHGVTHTRTHELTEAVRAPDTEDRHEPVGIRADRAAPADDAAHVVAEGIRGDAEHAGLRQRRGVDPAVRARHHEPSAGGVRVHDVAVEAERLEEFGHGAAARREGLRAAVERQAVEFDAADASAELIATLEHGDPQAHLRALERGDESRDTAADHDDVGPRPGFPFRGFLRHAARIGGVDGVSLQIP